MYFMWLKEWLLLLLVYCYHHLASVLAIFGSINKTENQSSLLQCGAGRGLEEIGGPRRGNWELGGAIWS
jgi:hypothetical protein